MDIKIEDIETGDLLLLNGKYFISKLIEYFTGSIFSHCGILIKNPKFFDNQLEGLYLLESGSEINPDSENNRKKIGVQLTKLDDIIKNYDGDLYIRKLKCEKGEDFYEKMEQIHSDLHNLPYDINPIDWLKAEFDIEVGNLQKKNTFWCSALVAYVYTKLGFLDENIPWTIIKPQDFSCTSKRLIFKNCILSDERKLLL